MTGRPVLAVLALVAGLLAGCGDAPAPPTPDDVARAVRAVRDAGTGRYELVAVRRDAAGTEREVWSAEYDLRRPAYHATGKLDSRAGRGLRGEIVGTSRAAYQRGFGRPVPDRWVLVPADAPDPSLPVWSRELLDAGVAPHLPAVLGFRASGVPGDVRPDGDGWVVTGTVPRLAAIVVVGITGAGPDEELRAAYRPGTAPARLVLGPDLRVRELRVAGADVVRGAGLPPGLGWKLFPATATLRLRGTGTPVTIRTPSPAARVPLIGP